MEYVVRIEADGNGFLVTCPDIPEMGCGGDTREEALADAVDNLVTALSIYVDERRPIPTPTRAHADDVTVRVSAQVALTALIHNEMLVQGVRKAELGRRLGMHVPQIDRLLNVCHETKLESLEKAAKALGKHVSVALAA
jgi:antitoxin HicB